MARQLTLGAVLVTLALGLAACGSGDTATKPKAEPAPASGNVQVRIAGFAYHPPRLVVRAGTTITWTDADSANHTVTAENGSFDVGNISRGERGSRRFTKPGSFAYQCNYHPNMHGQVVVR